MSFCLSKGIWADSCLRQQGGKEKSLTFVWLMLIIPDKLKKLNFARIACLKPFGEKGGKKGWRRSKRLFRCHHPVPLSYFPGTSPSRGRS